MAGAKKIIATKDRVRETKLGIFKQVKHDPEASKVFNRLNDDAKQKKMREVELQAQSLG